MEYKYFRTELEQLNRIKAVYNYYLYSLEKIAHKYYNSLNHLKKEKLDKKNCEEKIKFLYPIKKESFWISSYFGPRKNNGVNSMHGGLDMAALKGTLVRAAASGIVLEASSNNGYGKYILLFHTFKCKTRYAHLNSIYVEVGQVVKAGEVIGSVGDSGSVRKRGSDASHLHFEICMSDQLVDPLSYLE